MKKSNVKKFQQTTSTALGALTLAFGGMAVAEVAAPSVAHAQVVPGPTTPPPTTPGFEDETPDPTTPTVPGGPTVTTGVDVTTTVTTTNTNTANGGTGGNVHIDPITVGGGAGGTGGQGGAGGQGGVGHGGQGGVGQGGAGGVGHGGSATGGSATGGSATGGSSEVNGSGNSEINGSGNSEINGSGNSDVSSTNANSAYNGGNNNNINFESYVHASAPALAAAISANGCAFVNSTSVAIGVGAVSLSGGAARGQQDRICQAINASLAIFQSANGDPAIMALALQTLAAALPEFAAGRDAAVSGVNDWHATRDCRPRSALGYMGANVGCEREFNSNAVVVVAAPVAAAPAPVAAMPYVAEAEAAPVEARPATRSSRRSTGNGNRNRAATPAAPAAAAVVPGSFCPVGTTAVVTVTCRPNTPGNRQ